MTAIDRTAYPRPGEKLTRDELDSRYRISETEHAFIRTTARSDAAILKVRNFLDSQISEKMIELNRYAVSPSMG
jgi:hypothetical protein